MKKFWGKLVKDNRLIKDNVIIINNNNFYENLKEICYNLQIETPLILKKHKKEIKEFNTTKFKNTDFIDYINFDYLQVEYFED